MENYEEKMDNVRSMRKLDMQQQEHKGQKPKQKTGIVLNEEGRQSGKKKEHKD